MRLFSKFINKLNLLDLPLSVRRFTWIKEDSKTKNRLGRFLISSDWDLKWHFDWGPRPFRVLNAWFDDKDFAVFVKDGWETLNHPLGWRMGILKSKLQKLKQGIHNLDLKGEASGLNDDEIIHHSQLWADLWLSRSMQHNLLSQKSRCKWLKERDSNSEYFHSLVNIRRKSNSIQRLRIQELVSLRGPITSFGVVWFVGRQWAPQISSLGTVVFTVLQLLLMPISVSLGIGWGICGIGSYHGGVIFFTLELNILTSLLDGLKNVRLLRNTFDSWEWRHDSSKLYSVRSTYKQLTSSSCLMVDIYRSSSSIWNSRAPLKDKIPSKVALSRRGVPFNDSGGLLCSFCNDEPKSSTHLFSSYKVTYYVRQLLYNWLTIYVVLHQSHIQHYSHHSGLVSNKKSRKAWSII
ncbi:hypothetical protein Lal_00031175 [Lupinus albus]|nr:hypothetical protein Lal_00031175 [Lupinus albus]